MKLLVATVMIISFLPYTFVQAVDTQCGNQSVKEPFYFCMASDASYYHWLLNLIGSIHRVHADQIGEIAVFDIGLTQQQRDALNSIAAVHVYDVEMVHPDLLKKFSARGGKRTVPGWYAWKPVVLKQALDMFPYVLYLDAGMAIKKDLNPIFDHIKKHGHLMFKSIRSIKWMVTDYVVDAFKLKSPRLAYLLQESTKGFDAYIIGLTHDHYHDFVMPVYEMAKDLRNFAEDGSNTFARHDQTLLSIQAYLARPRMSFTPPESSIFQGCARADFFDIGVRFRKDVIDMTPYIHYKVNG